MERLQKVIANKGYCSRRKAEELILQGKVEVNGKVIKEMGYKVSYDDDILVEGNALSNKEEKIYFLLNKPRGVLSTVHDDKGRKTVVDLINTNVRIYPVGRLDYDTTGMIILTNDGNLTALLTHPKNCIDKKYIVKINGQLSKNDISKLRNGVLVDNRKTSKSQVKVRKYDSKTNTSLVELIIHEGKNHQVKKMFEAIGFKVLKLKREQIAFLTLDGLKSGAARELTIHEVKKLYSLGSK